MYQWFELVLSHSDWLILVPTLFCSGFLQFGGVAVIDLYWCLHLRRVLLSGFFCFFVWRGVLTDFYLFSQVWRVFVLELVVMRMMTTMMMITIVMMAVGM